MKKIIKIRFADWRWKEHPDLGYINKLQRSVFDGKHLPHITYIDTSDSDFGVVISSDALTDRQAQMAWEELHCEFESKSPFYRVIEIHLR